LAVLLFQISDLTILKNSPFGPNLVSSFFFFLISKLIQPCVFLGYSTHHKGYKCYHPKIGRIFISRDVIFHEEVFPFSYNTSQPAPSSPNPPSSSTVSVSLPLSIPRNIESSPPITLPPSTPSILPTNSSLPPPSLSSSSSPAKPDVSEAQTPTRIHPMRTRSQNNVCTIRQLTDRTVRYPLPRALLSKAALIEPTCFSNAVKISEWRNAMQVEFNALLKNKTWTLVPSSVAKSVVSCK
jgi:hypothetical protein